MEVIVVILAGLGAGIITGLVGGSAALVVTPMLTSLLGVEAYVAITIALATDVFASSISAVTYAKQGYIRIKSAIPLVIMAAVGSIIGSYLAQYIDSGTLGVMSAIVTLLLGINFIRTAEVPSKTEEEKNKNFFTEHQMFSKVFFGTIIGLICGIVGAGGGMMILLILTAVLGYELKEAVGTSVFIMTFTALTGAVAHSVHIDSIPFLLIFVSGISSIVGAYGAARFMGNASGPTSKRVAGVFLILIFLLTLINR